jgi:1,4-dihydroxy-2-naphthoyl-CoA hydrolase
MPAVRDATGCAAASLIRMPDDLAQRWEPVVPYERSFDASYGLELVSHDAAAGEIRGRFAVTDVTLSEHGLVQGGVFASAAEGLASAGTALVVMDGGEAAMGLSNDTTVLADVTAGAVHADARVVSRGEDAWLWTVDARDDGGRPCAHSRVTVAVRPLRRPAA